jgi:hypothetical protein
MHQPSVGRRSRTQSSALIGVDTGYPIGQPGAMAVSDFGNSVSDVRCRPAGTEDLTFLAAMLGEAAVWRPDKQTPTGDEVLADPRYAMYLAGWPRHGDHGLVAENGGPVGAAWYRMYTEVSHGYGFISEDVPELSAVGVTFEELGLASWGSCGLVSVTAVGTEPSVDRWRGSPAAPSRGNYGVRVDERWSGSGDSVGCDAHAGQMVSVA